MKRIKKTFTKETKRDIKLFCKIMKEEHGVSIVPHLYKTCSCCKQFNPEEILADGHVNLNVPRNWGARHIRVSYKQDDNIRKTLNRVAEGIFSNKEMYPELYLAEDVSCALLIYVADHA